MPLCDGLPPGLPSPLSLSFSKRSSSPACTYLHAAMPSLEPLLMLLRVAKEVSTELPVPGLSTALEIAVSIAEKAKVR